MEKQNRPMCMGAGKEGVGEMYGESGMEIYVIVCEIASQWEFAVCPGNSYRGSMTIWKGGVGRESGGRFRRGRGHGCTYG